MNALKGMYNHVLTNDGTVEFSWPPGSQQYDEAIARVPADERARLDECNVLLLYAWQQAGLAAQRHAAGNRAHGDASTRLHEQGDEGSLQESALCVR